MARRRRLPSTPVDALEDVTEKEILLDIFRDIRWIGRYLAVVAFLSLLGAGGVTVVVIADLK